MSSRPQSCNGEEILDRTWHPDSWRGSLRQAFGRLRYVLAALAATCALAQAPAAVQSALDRISANALRADVSFLASDLLQGRATPSPGLEIAAEFIASEFRRAGLEPAGDDGYFQTAHMKHYEPDLAGFSLTAVHGEQTLDLKADDVAVLVRASVDLKDVPVVLDTKEISGKVVIVSAAKLRELEGVGNLRRSMWAAGAVAVIVTGFRPRFSGRLEDATDEAAALPVVFTRGDAASAFLKKSPDTKLSIHIAAPKESDVPLKNVAAILRGADPALKDTWVMVTCHYDHIGVKAKGEGDRIFNGANDDASGVASMLQVSSALASLPERPKRSVLFVAFFGEEEGGYGSSWYGRHPVFPLAKTVADINLEQMGRTDDKEGAKLNSATLTGFDFSDMPEAFVKAGELTGINVYRDAKRSDAFFSRSDNQMLADKGIPAHTMCVAFEFPDYHAVGDEWQKIDYENMARVDRMVALGVWMLASNDKAPVWNATVPDAAPYVAAAEKLHPSAAAPPAGEAR